MLTRRQLGVVVREACQGRTERVMLDAQALKVGKRILGELGAGVAEDLQGEDNLIVFYRPLLAAFEVYPGRWEGNPAGTWAERGADVAEQGLHGFLRAGGVKSLAELAQALIGVQLEAQPDELRAYVLGKVINGEHADRAAVMLGYWSRLQELAQVPAVAAAEGAHA